MKENAGSPDVKLWDPKGFVIVSMLLATEQIAVVLIGVIVKVVGGKIVHGPGTRIIDEGKFILICELLGRDDTGLTVT